MGVILTTYKSWDDPPSSYCIGILGWLPRLDDRNHMEPKNHLIEKETHLQQHHSQAKPPGFFSPPRLPRENSRHVEVHPRHWNSFHCGTVRGAELDIHDFFF